MTETQWLIDETQPIGTEDESLLARQLGPRRSGRQAELPLALTLHDVVIHDNRKWFGEADIRLDMLVTTGRPVGDKDPSFFVPQTHSFPRVRDGESLPIASGGLIGFYGTPAHFLDVSIIVSRDKRDVESLAALLKDTKDSDVVDAVGTVAGLVGAPHVAAVKAALDAALVLSNAAYRLLHALTGATIGLYRNSHLQHRDGFGIGRHPEEGSYRRKDLSFNYAISVEA